MIQNPDCPGEFWTGGNPTITLGHRCDASLRDKLQVTFGINLASISQPYHWVDDLLILEVLLETNLSKSLLSFSIPKKEGNSSRHMTSIRSGPCWCTFIDLHRLLLINLQQTDIWAVLQEPKYFQNGLWLNYLQPMFFSLLIQPLHDNINAGILFTDISAFQRKQKKQKINSQLTEEP